MTFSQDDCKHHEEDIDKLKFRNEIEAFARLKGLGSTSGLYDNSINDKVSSSLCEVYHEGPSLSLESPGDMFNSLVNKPDNIDKQSDNNSTAKLECAAVDDIINDYNHISWDAYLRLTLDAYDNIDDKVTFLLNVIQLCTSLLKSFWV